jgi:hypothetical protein
MRRNQKGFCQIPRAGRRANKGGQSGQISQESMASPKIPGQIFRAQLAGRSSHGAAPISARHPPQ